MQTTTLPTIPVLAAIPDDNYVKLDAAGDARAPRMVVPGSAPFMNYLPPSVQRHLPMVHYSHSGQFKRGADRPTPFINLGADPDVARGALENLQRALAGTGQPCFNHPTAVLDSSRDAVARKLRAIDGLVVPTTCRARLAEPRDLLPIMEAHGLQWPVIVRITGVHSGSATIRIDSEAEVASKLSTIPWGGRELYVTQFVDYRDADGMYRKLRFAIVGPDAFLRHEITAHEWQVHTANQDWRFLEHERELLETFPTDLLPRIRDRLRAVADAMKLDLFGVDCSLRPNGGLLIFECNAAMNLLRERRIKGGYDPNEFQPDIRPWEMAVERIRNALVPLLFNPASWRYSALRRTERSSS